MTEQLPPFLPSAEPETWLGMLGGGQLGRMFVHAAQEMGYKVAVLEPAKDCPAGDAADHLLPADYTDLAGLAELAEQCVAVTTEFENVPADSLAFLAERTFISPSASAVSIAQDRIAEKIFFTECGKNSGVMPAPYHGSIVLPILVSYGALKAQAEHPTYRRLALQNRKLLLEADE